ncbi:MAG: DUF5320 domain-containing protein [Kiritimatiellae bacterium]|nr:DUF5320 domain-containing protein [Kiritimatiellia bacterium]
MPRGDGTGPLGMGPMTGRAAGYCAGNFAPGRGFGRGPGRRWFSARAGQSTWGDYPSYGTTTTTKQESNALKGQAQYLSGALEYIKQRIEELDTKTNND